MPSLLHFISDQRMQNLLPLLAIRNPERIIQVHAAEEKFEQIADDIQKAAELAGVEAEFSKHALKGDAWDIAPARQAIKYWLPVFPGCVVNITGGTKLMCIGAYLGAGEFHDAPILYCDTQNRAFLSLGKTHLPEMLPFDQVVRQLTVEVIMTAHGKAFKAEPREERLLEFGRKAAALHHHHFDQIADWTSAVRNSIPVKENGHLVEGAKALRAFIDAPLPAPQSESVAVYSEEAVDAGLLKRGPNSLHFNSKPKASSVSSIRNLLQGSWLEWALADVLLRSDQYPDVQVGVQPSASNQDFGETDVVAVDAHRAALSIFSCKTNLAHIQPLEHLASFRDRANRLGGSHATATLLVWDFGDARRKQAIEKTGRLLNVHVLSAKDVLFPPPV